MRVPVLMYHALEDAEHPAGAEDPGEQLYVLPVDQFAAQMSCLKEAGYRTFLFEELLELKDQPEKAVVLTFDDGHRSNFTLALPILKKLGFKAHFFITTDWISTSNFMDEEQIRCLHEAGMAIGSHGMSHRFLPDLAKLETEYELDNSKTILEACIGASVVSMSYPGGRMDSGTHSIAKSLGYSQIFSSVPGYFKLGRSHQVVPRFAITCATTIETFRSLIHGDASRTILLRHSILGTVKYLLGNRIYVRIRSALIHSEK